MKRKAWKIGPAIIVLSIFIHSIINAANAQVIKDYFSIPFYAIINITIAIYFAYFLTQHRNDMRKKKEIAQDIIEKVLIDLTSEKMYVIFDEDALKYISIKQRSVKNRLDMLKEYEKSFCIKEDIKYINDNINMYWDFVSNHIHDLEYLKKSEGDLLKYITNSINRLEKMVVQLYI